MEGRSTERKKPCPVCQLLITASNLARHLKVKHAKRDSSGAKEGNEKEEYNEKDDEEYNEKEEEMEDEADDEDNPKFRVLPGAAPFKDKLQSFLEYQIMDDSRSPAEATTATSVVQHFLLFAQSQEADDDLPATGCDVHLLDRLLLKVHVFAPWLRSGSLTTARPATKVAYLNRFQRFLQWRLANLGSLLDERHSPIRVGIQTVILHLQSLRCKYKKQARTDQRVRLNKEELQRRGQWAELRDLAKAVDVNMARFEAQAAAAVRKDYMPLGKRSYCIQFVLAAVAVLAPPARPGFWMSLTLKQYKEATKSREHLLSSTAFKTSDKYGYKTLRLSEKVLQVLKTYVCRVRPFSCSTRGVVTTVDNGNEAPLFLKPSGGVLTKMSPYVTAFFKLALGVDVNVTRIRSIAYTACTKSATVEDTALYARGDTHSCMVAKV